MKSKHMKVPKNLEEQEIQYQQEEAVFTITGAQDKRHQAKINAVCDRILEVCENFKAHLAERIYFSKDRFNPISSPENKGTLHWDMRPPMKRLKECLDDEMNKFNSTDDIKLDFYSSKGTNLVKQYWVLNHLVTTFHHGLNEKNVKLETIKKLKTDLSQFEDIFLLPTDDVGFLKLDHDNGYSSFEFFKTIWQLIKSLFEKPPSQRFFNEINKLGINAPKLGKDIQYSCLEDGHGEEEVNYQVAQI